VASEECYNKKTELFLSDNFYFPAGMTVTFSKSCHGCELHIIEGEVFNFYEVRLGAKAAGKRVTLTISPK
jgi:hypothetical protein